jgi:ArsR family transcriptional regulator
MGILEMAFRPELIGQVVKRLRALADENRIRLLLRLRQGECNVSTLTDDLSLGQASVSKHLAVLRNVGLVEVTRQGTQAIYRVRDESVFELCELVCSGVVRHLRQEHAAWAEAIKGPRPARAAPTTRKTGGPK